MSRSVGKHAARKSRWRTAALGLLTGGVILASGLAPTAPAIAEGANSLVLEADTTYSQVVTVTVSVVDGRSMDLVNVTAEPQGGDNLLLVGRCEHTTRCVLSVPVREGGVYKFAAAYSNEVGGGGIIENVEDTVNWWNPSYSPHADASVGLAFPDPGGQGAEATYRFIAADGSGAPDVIGSTTDLDAELPATAFVPGVHYTVSMQYDAPFTGGEMLTGPVIDLDEYIGAVAAVDPFSAISGDSYADLAWGPPSNIEPTTEYTNRIKIHDTVRNITTTLDVPGADTSVRVALTNGTRYDIWIVSVLGLNESGTTETITVTPITTPAVPVISAVGMDSAAAVTARFPSTTAAPSSRTDAIWQVSTLDGTIIPATVSPNAPVVISGLTNGESYRVRVKATNAAGESPWSEWTDAFSPSAIPATPTVANEAAKQGTLSVDLTLPTTTGAAATGSTWQLGTVQADNSVKWENAFPTMTGTTAVFTGLTDGADYLVRAQSTNAAGASDWATSAVLRPISAPETPTVEMAVADSGSLLVNLAATQGSDARPIVGYVWEVAPQTGATAGVWQSVTAVSTADGYLIDGLTEGTLYDIHVAASNPAGASAWAAWSPDVPVDQGDSGSGNPASGDPASSDPATGGSGSDTDDSVADVPDSDESTSAEPTSAEPDVTSPTDPHSDSDSLASAPMSFLDPASIIPTSKDGKDGNGASDNFDRGAGSAGIGATMPAHRSDIALRSILIAAALLLLFLIAFGFWWLLLLARRRKKEEEDEEAAALAAALEAATAVQ
jgi:hypothetical protein